MINLLDFQSKRIINIIHFLANKNAQLTVNDIAEINECSDKTVYNDIKYIQNSWNGLLGIERYNDLFVANIKSQSHFKFIYSEILSNSNAIKILVEIFLKPNQSIHYYATKTNTSITNLYNTIKSINQKLELYEINIINENRTFKVRAKSAELHILFFTMIFLEPEIQKQYKCSEAVTLINKRLSTVFTDEYEVITLLDFYSIYYYVSLLYAKNNKTYEKINEVHINQLITPDLFFYKDLKKFFPLRDNDDFKLIEFEIEKICQIRTPMDEKRIISMKNFLADRLAGHTKFLDDERLCNIVKIINIIENGYIIRDIDIPHFTNRFESFSTRIEARSPYSHNYLVNMFYDLGKEFNIDLKYSVHDLIYWITLTFQDIHYIRNKRILIVSDHNAIHAEYLKNHVQKQLQSYDYESYYLKDCENWKKDFDERNYFRIISTSKLKDISEEKVIVIGDYISLDDLAGIFLNIDSHNQRFNKDIATLR